MIDEKSRSELQLEWKAVYKDGSTLHQFDDKADEERHFGHINQGRLSEFVLASKVTPDTVSVSLETGLFYVNGEPLEVLKIDDREVSLGVSFLNKQVENKKLIYFRRVKREFDMGMGKMNVSMAYIIGYEARIAGLYPQTGKKIKELLQVNPNGTITIYEDPEKVAGFTRL